MDLYRATIIELLTSYLVYKNIYRVKHSELKAFINIFVCRKTLVVYRVVENTCCIYRVVGNTFCIYRVVANTCCIYRVEENSCCIYRVIENTCCLQGGRKHLL